MHDSNYFWLLFCLFAVLSKCETWLNKYKKHQHDQLKKEIAEMFSFKEFKFFINEQIEKNVKGITVLRTTQVLLVRMTYFCLVDRSKRVTNIWWISLPQYFHLTLNQML